MDFSSCVNGIVINEKSEKTIHGEVTVTMDNSPKN